MIHILDGQTDVLLAYLDGQGDGIFVQDEIEQGINGLSTLTFSALSSSDSAVHLRDLNRVLVPHERQGWQEYVIYETVVDNDFITVYCVGSETQLNTRKVIEPATHTAFTLKQYVSLATSGTEWEEGVIEYAGTHTLTFTDFMLPYNLLKSAERAFGMELSFRIEVAGNKVVGRYVDVYEKIGSGYIGKEFVNAKDLIGVQKKIHNDRIVTALEVVGPKPQDGPPLRAFVSDEEAFQRWNYLGLHIIDLYTPETDDPEMSLSALEGYARTALKKRIDSVVEYSITTVDLSEIIGYEATYLGDTVRIKDTDFNPPLYAEARIINVKSPIRRADEEIVEKTYTIGEVVEYTEEDILAKFRDMQAAYGLRVVKSATPPVGSANIIWIKTDPNSAFEISYSWDGSKWVPMTAETPAALGAETPGGARNKAIDTYVNVIETEREQTVNKYDSIYLNPDLVAGTVKTALATAKANYDTGYTDLMAEINAAKADGSTSLTEKAAVDVSYAEYSQTVGLLAKAMEEATREIEEEKMLRSRFFTWIKYADSPTTGISDLPAGKSHMGIAYNKESAVESSTYADYSWSLITGEGIEGPQGPGGESLYTWIKYADNVVGGGMADAPTGKKYIGIAYNKTTISESSTAGDYTWALIQGPQGVEGQPGENGLPTYTWIKYADTPTTGMAESPTGKKYMGIAANKLDPNESSTYSDYSWSLIVGEKGDTGIPGDPGEDGLPTYIWVKYADTPTTGMADLPAGKSYLGLAYNKPTAAESSVYGDYSWSKIEGPTGPQGPTLYTWIRYATTPTTGMADVPTGKDYIGIAYNKTTATESGTYADYSWSLIKGPGGPEGPQGPGGVTTYTWFKYADSSTGAGLSDSPEGKRYLGMAFNKTTATESTTASDYTWSPLFDNVVVGGRNLIPRTSESYKTMTTGMYYSAITEAGRIPLQSLRIYAGDEVTFRAYIKATSLDGAKVRINFFKSDGSYGANVSATSILPGQEGYSSVTVVVPAGHVDIQFTLQNTDTSRTPTTSVSYKEAKGEIGNIPTDWTPAPEDVAADTAAAQAAADKAIADSFAAQGTANGAQSTANGKNTVFYQTAAPSTAGRRTGDIWFDTDDGNKMYGYNGGWVLEQFGVNAIADLSITNAKIADATISDAKISNLNAAKITAGVMSADRINATTLSAIAANLGTVTAGILRNATSTNVIDMNAGTISLGSGNFTVSGSTVTFKGALSGATGTFAGSLSAATGTFSGALSGATGTFSGSLSAATGTFKGTVDVGSANDKITLAGNTFTSFYNDGYTSSTLTMNRGRVLIEDIEHVFSSRPTTSVSLSQQNVTFYSSNLNTAETRVSYGVSNTNSQVTAQIYSMGTMSVLAPAIHIETSSGDMLRLAYGASQHGYMSWYSGSTREAYMGFGSNNTNVFSLYNQRPDGYYQITGASGVHMAIDALSDGHTRIRGSNGPIVKFLKSLSQIQFRNFADSAYCSIISSGHTAVSQRALKKNITPYEEDALHEILTTPIREYHFNEDGDWEPKRVGIILDEAPLSAINLTGQGVVEYQMVSMAWRAIQQLNDQVDELNAKILTLQAETEVN